MTSSTFKTCLFTLVLCLWAGQRAGAQEIIFYPDSLNLAADPDDSERFTLAIRVIAFDEVAGLNLRLEFGGGLTVDSAYFAPGINALPGSFLPAGNALNMVFLNLDALGTSLPDEAAFFFVRLRLPAVSAPCYSVTFTELEAVKISDPTVSVPSLGVDVACLVIDAALSGTLTYASSGSPLGGVLLEAVSADTAWQTLSDSAGFYRLEGLPVGIEYAVVPLAKTDEAERADRLRGINILDMIAMQRHILGTAPFSSPYQYIAADVNADGQISTLDLIGLQGYLLFRTDAYPDNPYWRFIAADHAFDPDDPLQAPFPEFIGTGPLLGSRTGLDFIGLKVGDANLDAY
jgi:hypothetical protein